MNLIAAIKDVAEPRPDGSGTIVFSWADTCSRDRERVFAAMTAARAAEGGKLKPGDIVTVGYNAHFDQVILAAPRRDRLVVKVVMGAEEAEEVVRRLGWETVRVDVPTEAEARFQQTPYEWLIQAVYDG